MRVVSFNATSLLAMGALLSAGQRIVVSDSIGGASEAVKELIVKDAHTIAQREQTNYLEWMRPVKQVNTGRRQFKTDRAAAKKSRKEQLKRETSNSN